MRVGISLGAWFGDLRVSQTYQGIPDNTYVFAAAGVTFNVVPTLDLTGKLRIGRTDSTLYGSYWNGSMWVTVGSGAVSDQKYPFYFLAFTDDRFFTHQEVQVKISNAKIMADVLLLSNQPYYPPQTYIPMPEPSIYMDLMFMVGLTLYGYRRQSVNGSRTRFQNRSV